MAKATYDIQGMKSAASQIRSELSKYETAMKKMNETVSETRTYFQDDRQEQFVKKYDALKDTMSNMKLLMEQYAIFLEQAADHFEKVGKTNI